MIINIHNSRSVILLSSGNFFGFYLVLAELDKKFVCSDKSKNADTDPTLTNTNTDPRHCLVLTHVLGLHMIPHVFLFLGHIVTLITGHLLRFVVELKVSVEQGFRCRDKAALITGEGAVLARLVSFQVEPSGRYIVTFITRVGIFLGFKGICQLDNEKKIAW